MLVLCIGSTAHHQPLDGPSSPHELLWLVSVGLFSAGLLGADPVGTGRRGEAGNICVSSRGGVSLAQLQWIETAP